MDVAHAHFATSVRVPLPAQTAKTSNGGSGVSGPAVNAVTLFRGTNESVSSAA